MTDIQKAQVEDLKDWLRGKREAEVRTIENYFEEPTQNFNSNYINSYVSLQEATSSTGGDKVSCR